MAFSTLGDTPSDAVATLCDFGQGTLVGAIASDSTANNSNDWVFVGLQKLAERLDDSVGILHYPWLVAEDQWRTFPTVIKEGEGRPGSGGVVLRDTFSRTGNIVGSTPDQGPVWGGENTSNWTADGSKAVNSAGTGGFSADIDSRDGTITAEISMVTAATGAVPSLRFYLGSSVPQLGDGGVWAQLALSSTGVPNLSLWKRFGGVNTQLGAADFSLGLTSNTRTPQSITVSISTNIQDVVAQATAGGTVSTINGTIGESEYPQMGTLAGVRASLWNAAQGGITEITLETPETPSTFSGLTMWNAAVAGTRLEYQLARLRTVYNQERLDFLILAAGHNYGTIDSTPEEFIAAVDGFTDAFQAEHPETLIIVSSQNPQFSPSPYVAPHAARQAAIRRWARERGFEYLPAFESFAARHDGGASLVNPADGVHPTVHSGSALTRESGSVFWADVWMRNIDAQRVVRS